MSPLRALFFTTAPVAGRAGRVRLLLLVATMSLRTIRDYQGGVIEALRSPVDGYVMYGITGPPVRAGDEVVTIGKPWPTTAGSSTREVPR